MAINENVGKEALAEPKKFLDNLIFRDAKHFVFYFIKKGFSLAGKPIGMMGKKGLKVMKYKITKKHSSELNNKAFLKKVGSRQVRSHFAYEIAGLDNKDLEKVSIEDVKKSLSKYNIDYTLVKNSYTGEIKFKMQTKDSHIFEEVREDLIKKINKSKTVNHKRHSLMNLYNHKDSKAKDNLLIEKVKATGLSKNKDKNKDIGLGR